MSAFPRPPLLFLSVHLSSTYCKQGWWDWGWKGLPVATDPITKPVFPVLGSTGCTKWCRESRELAQERGSVYVFFVHSCVFEDTHAGRCKCVSSALVVCVSQRLMACWAPPLVEVNIREQATYYYWSTPGQNSKPCVSRYCFFSFWWWTLPALLLIGAGEREWARATMETERYKGRNIDQQAQRQRAINSEKLSENQRAIERGGSE